MATTPFGRERDLLGIGTARGEEAERRGREGGAGELYSLAARDRPCLQTHSQVVEVGCSLLVTVPQQRNSSFH